MRGRAFHGPMRATACSASLRCHRSRDTRPDRPIADDAEAVFVLATFGRFAQFSENQRQRANSGDQKACGYEHDVNQARFAPLSVGSTLSYQFPLFRKSQDTPIDTYFSSDYESGKQGKQEKEMDWEPVFALLLYCVTDPDQENNSCVPTFLIASLCETWKRLLFASRNAHKTREVQQKKRFCVFQSGNRIGGGCPPKTNAHNRQISFRRLCLAEFCQPNPSDFCTGLSDPEHLARHHVTAEPALRGAHLLSKSPFQGIARETQAELESVLSQATNE